MPLHLPCNDEEVQGIVYTGDRRLDIPSSSTEIEDHSSRRHHEQKQQQPSEAAERTGEESPCELVGSGFDLHSDPRSFIFFNNGN